MIENFVRVLIPTRNIPVWLRYLATVAMVGVALAINLSLAVPAEQAPFLLFVPVVLLAALLYDRGS
ncbi:MAG: hypothetical protein AB7P20_18200 [Rhizobiaceae bacterium]